MRRQPKAGRHSVFVRNKVWIFLYSKFAHFLTIFLSRFLSYFLYYFYSLFNTFLVPKLEPKIVSKRRQFLYKIRLFFASIFQITLKNILKKNQNSNEKLLKIQNYINYSWFCYKKNTPFCYRFLIIFTLKNG